MRGGERDKDKAAPAHMRLPLLAPSLSVSTGLSASSSGARGHAALVAWASLMTFFNLALLFLLFPSGSFLPFSPNLPPSTPLPSTALDTEVCTASAFQVSGANSSWFLMKQVPPPAQCRVQGFVLERLEPEYNFRRGWALGYASSPQDRTHLLPYLRPVQDRDMATRKRRVLVALGAQRWENVVWFLRNYPLDFTEIHLFEEKKGQLKKPSSGIQNKAPLNGLLESMSAQSQVEGAGKLAIPDVVLERVRLYYSLLRNEDIDPGASSMRTVNVTKVLLHNLKLKKEDAVVLLMDIEHAEWEVLPVWMAIPELPQVIDDMFVQVHYQHESMAGFEWTKGHSREEAARLLLQMRFKGFFVHAWP